jgi:hypothetical protein
MAASRTYAQLVGRELDDFLKGVASSVWSLYGVATGKADALSDSNILKSARPLFEAMCGHDKKLTGGSARKFLVDFYKFVCASTETSHPAVYELSRLPEWKARSSSSNTPSSGGGSAAGEEDDETGDDGRADDGIGRSEKGEASGKAPRARAAGAC